MKEDNRLQQGPGSERYHPWRRISRCVTKPNCSFRDGAIILSVRGEHSVNDKSTVDTSATQHGQPSFSPQKTTLLWNDLHWRPHRLSSCYLRRSCTVSQCRVRYGVVLCSIYEFSLSKAATENVSLPCRFKRRILLPVCRYGLSVQTLPGSTLLSHSQGLYCRDDPVQHILPCLMQSRHASMRFECWPPL